jgi:SnoaL-like domain
MITRVPAKEAPNHALIARLELLEAERAILETLYQYGHAVDYGPDADWLSCFTEDGVWDIRMRNNPSASFRCEGQAELRAGLDAQSTVRVPAVYVKHLVVEPRIVISGDDATVESYFLRVEPGETGGSRIVASGRYLDRMVRCDDGRWRFKERIAEIDDM